MLLTGTPHKLLKNDNQVFINIDNDLYNAKTLEFHVNIDKEAIAEYKTRGEIIVDIFTVNSNTYILTQSSLTYKIYKNNVVVLEKTDVTDCCINGSLFYYISNNTIFSHNIENGESVKILEKKNIRTIGYCESIVYSDNNTIYFDNKIYHTHSKKIQKLYTTSTNIYSACTEKVVRYNIYTEEKTILYNHNNDFVDFKDDTLNIYILLNTKLVTIEKATGKTSIVLLLNKNIKYKGYICDAEVNDEKESNDLFKLKFEDTKMCSIGNEIISGQHSRYMTFADAYALYMVVDNKLAREFRFNVKYENCFVHNSDCFMIQKGKNARDDNKLVHCKLQQNKLYYHNVISINIEKISQVIYIDGYYVLHDGNVTVFTESGMIAKRYSNIIGMAMHNGIVLATHDGLLCKDIKIEDKILQIAAFYDDLYVLTNKGLYSCNYKKYMIMCECYTFTVAEDCFILGSDNQITFFNHKYETLRDITIDYKIDKIISETICIDDTEMFRDINK